MFTQQFTVSMSALNLNPERNGPAVILVSLLNNSVNKLPWIAEKFFSSYNSTNFFGF